MSNLILLPILIPFLIGAILILFAKKIAIQRFISGLSAISMLLVSIFLAIHVYQEGIAVLELGNWPAPFGIVIVADMFATMMLILSSIVGLVCLFFAFQTLSTKREKSYFYPFYFFLLAGVNGAFLTGDLFNLFVFFEVMLISSYILIVIGGTKYQLRESFKYVVMNVFASILFLVGVAYIYSVTGTLNLADLAVKIEGLEQVGVLNVIAVIFLVVFAMKGGLFPLYFWLPRSYYGPPAAIAALFGALLTKVGIYAIMRTFTLVFTHDPDFTHTLILILAGLTMFFGVLGAVSQFDFKRILSYHIISQVGYMVMGLGIFTPLAIAGAIYYIAHHIIVKAALFLFAGATQKITGTTDLKQMGGLLKTHPVLAWLFFISAISLAGIPPLSGFFSKFALILAAFLQENYIIATVALVVGLLTLFSMMKIFMYAFWGEQKHTEEQAQMKIGKLLIPIIPLVALTIGLGFLAEPIFQYSLQVAEQLLDPTIYIESVLKE
ncbi:cation:proton antiporter [Alkalihalobacillus alcalophilus ATCC 27647 = CGMCC 1.3604]|uniref:Cation:proton antiporter n=1 Tax=Alkalihalobacillus alcalophilus ATCC 27647 = CGMCC 1.3604 TaxID=1218173 RepID=J8TQ08_ALKAL|nr:Na+/H+ antiporter subunit D [Alkalihalobacillus alcalophilus]AFV25872.1 multicomponent sodium ion:proton antiporter transporter [Alkalihalobacillus alcalophilus ATCC 27647 = CGMCC 1.3604]KGA97128.1 monovalent cation/H+ antiporter subunit D [Alkalihalobacillus alcalophilus ATCC 27647 = CGMCC 1.3604]MED1560600.1 Na+/H+ antiporter subunit D [Alkalihalobacillus alcalophilus]THG89076.1 cation:proton antiporter [Alkalihalobacillus alcalophilus ATCC 27647 = CGMCC 1.3604]